MGNRRITADTALRLSAYFGTTAKFWLGLQDDYDLELESTINPDMIKSIRTRMAGKPVSQIRINHLRQLDHPQRRFGGLKILR